MNWLPAGHSFFHVFMERLQNFSTTLRCTGLFPKKKKDIEKKHLCYHDKNYYYFCKSNTPVINCD